MAVPLAVADTSVLIALHHLDLLTPLRLFYDRVLVPAAVRGEFLQWEERMRPGGGAALTVLISEPPFEPCDDYDTIELQLLLVELDPGESEALAQLKRHGAGHILMDERAGRGFAERVGYTAVGTVRLIVNLHLQGFVSDPQAAVRRLRKEIKFKANDALVARALHEAKTERG